MRFLQTQPDMCVTAASLVLYLGAHLMPCRAFPMHVGGLDASYVISTRNVIPSNVYTLQTSYIRSSSGTSTTIADEERPLLEASYGDDAVNTPTIGDMPALVLDCIISHLRDPRDAYSFRRALRAANDAFPAFCERHQRSLVNSGKQTWFEAASLVLHRSSALGVDRSHGSPVRMSAEAAIEQLAFIVDQASWSVLEWQRLIIKAQLLNVEHAKKWLHAAVPDAIHDEVMSFTDEPMLTWVHPPPSAARDGREESPSQFPPPSSLCHSPWIDQNEMAGGSYTALQFTVVFGDIFGLDPLQFTRFLLDCGADPRMPSKWSSVIHSAALRGGLPLMQLLLDRAPDLVNVRTIYDQTPLIFAAGSGDGDVVRMLLDRGADVHAREATYRSMAHFDAATPEIAMMLLDAGAPVDAEDIYGCTALIWHIRRQRIDVVRVFLERHAILLNRSHSARTVLQVAMDTGNAQLVQLLMMHVGNLNPTSSPPAVSSRVVHKY